MPSLESNHVTSKSSLKPPGLHLSNSLVAMASRTPSNTLKFHTHAAERTIVNKSSLIFFRAIELE
jgi:hypothetical protein